MKSFSHELSNFNTLLCEARRGDPVYNFVGNTILHLSLSSLSVSLYVLFFDRESIASLFR